MFDMLVHLDLYRSRSKVKVIGQTPRSHDEKCAFSATDARYAITRFRLFVEFFALTWSLRPRVRAF